MTHRYKNVTLHASEPCCKRAGVRRIKTTNHAKVAYHFWGI